MTDTAVAAAVKITDLNLRLEALRALVFVVAKDAGARGWTNGHGRGSDRLGERSAREALEAMDVAAVNVEGLLADGVAALDRAEKARDAATAERDAAVERSQKTFSLFAASEAKVKKLEGVLVDVRVFLEERARPPGALLAAVVAVTPPPSSSIIAEVADAYARREWSTVAAALPSLVAECRAHGEEPAFTAAFASELASTESALGAALMALDEVKAERAALVERIGRLETRAK